MAKKYVKSPLNYTGGKYKLLPQIIPLFPENISTFVDLFGGGFNVGVNIKAEKIIYNELETHVYDFISSIYSKTTECCIKEILKIVEEYKLSKTNSEGFNLCRSDYNNNKNWAMFYAVVSHAFNYQIRYNKSGNYNMPFGKDRSSFNPSLQNNFIDFLNVMKLKKIHFSNKSFDELKVDKLTSKDLVYCDPPYLITLASYNESDGWNENKEIKLLNLLDELNSKNIRFALSNVLEHKGNKNKILIEWAKKYKINYLDYDYKNCSYQGKDTDKKTIEVLITNY